MNQQDFDLWKSEVLDEVFAALAASRSFDDVLIYKGARVLRARLGGGRQSRDLDSNLTHSFVSSHTNRDDQQAFLEKELPKAIRHHFERQEPVVFSLASTTFTRRPKKAHRWGWESFIVTLQVDDHRTSLSNLPAVEIEITSPEPLNNTSVSTLDIRGHLVQAYTLERIAGEKLRAFLSSLPAYRRKIQSRDVEIRERDLYDVARIRRAFDLSDKSFWQVVGTEFHTTCGSRFIDCFGMETFQEQWPSTREKYEKSSIIPKDIPFEEAEAAIAKVVEFLTDSGIIPFHFDLPKPSPG